VQVPLQRAQPFLDINGSRPPSWREAGRADEFGPLTPVWPGAFAVDLGNRNMGNFVTERFEQYLPRRGQQRG
jgi:hypothetical protein